MHTVMQAVPLNRPDVPIQTGSSRWGGLALPLYPFWCNPETWRVLLLHRHTADLPPTKSPSVKQHPDIFSFLGQLEEFQTWAEPNPIMLQVKSFLKTNILHFKCCRTEHRRVELSQWEGKKKHTWSARCDMFYFARVSLTEFVVNRRSSQCLFSRSGSWLPVYWLRCDAVWSCETSVRSDPPAWFSHNKINKPEVSDSFQSDRKTI